jgi:hypothetical protein
MTDPVPDEPVPLGFKVVVVLAAGYVALRLIQAIFWLGARIL